MANISFKRPETLSGWSIGIPGTGIKVGNKGVSVGIPGSNIAEMVGVKTPRIGVGTGGISLSTGGTSFTTGGVGFLATGAFGVASYDKKLNDIGKKITGNNFEAIAPEMQKLIDLKNQISNADGTKLKNKVSLLSKANNLINKALGIWKTNFETAIVQNVGATTNLKRMSSEQQAQAMTILTQLKTHMNGLLPYDLQSNSIVRTQNVYIDKLISNLDKTYEQTAQRETIQAQQAQAVAVQQQEKKATTMKNALIMGALGIGAVMALKG